MRFLERGLDAYRKLRSKRGYTCDDCGREIFSYPTERLCEGCLSLLEKTIKASVRSAAEKRWLRAFVSIVNAAFRRLRGACPRSFTAARPRG